MVPPPVLLRALLGLLLVLGLAAPATAASVTSAPGADDEVGATVLIGTGGLTWSDVTRETTPHLWALLRDGSAAVMSIRSVVTNTCPVDGWLGLSAGGRAWDPRTPPGNPVARPCPALPDVPSGDGGTGAAGTAGSVGAAGAGETTGAGESTTATGVAGATVPGWDRYVAAARDSKFDSVLGTLGQQAADADVCVQAVGPGAGIAAATHDGTVAHWAAFEPERLLRPLNGCRIVIVDVGAVRDPGDVAAGEPTKGTRAEQIAAVDSRIGAVLGAAPLGADVIVASLSDAGRSERLRLVVAKGPRFGPGRLDSPSTRQPGLIQAQDLTVTLLSLNGIPVPSTLGGRTITSRPAQDNSEASAQQRLQALVDQDLASHEVHRLVPPFFTVFAYGQLVIYLLVLLVWKGRIGSADSRLGALRGVRVLAVCAASVPAATFLANLLPWWRVPWPMLGVVGAVGIFVAVIAGLALAGRWGRTTGGPMAVVSAATMLVLGIDVMTGSRLQQSSLMGLQPVVAGRFYGMGNVTYAIFVTAAILLATAVSSRLVRAGARRTAAVAASAIGLIALVVDGAPFWGADGGGPPATIPGFAYLVLAILGVTLTWRRVLLIGVACVAIFLGVATLDWLRGPQSRTHLGSFIQSIIDGGALDIIVRKGEQNLSILLGNAPLTLLVPAALLFVAYVLARPTSWGARGMQRAYTAMPTLRAGLVALVVTLTIGFLINDSGTAIPAVGATVAVPLIVATLARALIDEQRRDAPTRRARRA